MRNSFFSMMFLLCCTGLYAQQIAEDAANTTSHWGLGIGRYSLGLSYEGLKFEGSEIDFGNLRPIMLSPFFQMRFPEKFVFRANFDLILSETSGGIFSLGGGYYIGNRRFGIIPVLNLGYGVISNQLKSYEIDDLLIIQDKVFLGPSERGSNLKLKLSHGVLVLRPETRIQVQIGKLLLFGNCSYNLAATGKGRIELSGRGYQSRQEYLDSPQGEAPPQISETDEISGYLTDSNLKPVSRSPLRFSGISWNFGVGFRF
jgi:hypothetical protein